MPPLCLQRGHVCQLQTQTSQVLVSPTLPILAFILQLFNAIPNRNSAHLDVALHGLDVVGSSSILLCIWLRRVLSRTIILWLNELGDLTK
ncbi:hypothetical protein GGS24DRAFT_475190 [Hypoxylon argillaceum]|nr:hypothetical protein GGS24DRAFT_475190 [Hypoxylon argillaceum]